MMMMMMMMMRRIGTKETTGCFFEWGYGDEREIEKKEKHCEKKKNR